MSVFVNPPKTPVTKGSNGTATASIPNICKMPGPPAPFVPAPLPNIGKSGKSPQDYTNDVTVEGDAVAIRGSNFASMGDIASKGTGGGMVSANCEGITKFVGPGSMDTKFEGGSVQFLSDPMLNNCGPGGSPPNAATLLGVLQRSGLLTPFMADVCPVCGRNHGALRETRESHDSAAGLAAQWTTVAGGNRSTMLGVAHCRTCDARYGDKSGQTTAPFCTAAGNAGLRHRGIGDPDVQQPADPLQPFRDRLGPNFNRLQQFGTFMFETFQARRRQNPPENRDAAYPPFSCAGQKVISLLLDRGGLPGALTERWHSSTGQPTSGRMAYLSRGVFANVPANLPGGLRAGLPGSMNAAEPLQDTFAHGETTPPCRTCETIVPFLLCTQAQVQCTD